MPETETERVDVEALRVLLDAAHDEVVRLCTPGATWRMSIPANPARDSDLMLSDALTQAAALLAELAASREALARVEALADAEHPATPAEAECSWRDRDGFEVRRRCEGCVDAAFEAGTTARLVRSDYHDAECPTPPAEMERQWRDPVTGVVGPIHDPVCAALAHDDEDSCSCGAAEPDAGDADGLAESVYRTTDLNLPLSDPLDIDCHDVARAVLASDWLAVREREAGQRGAEKALRDAADALVWVRPAACPCENPEACCGSEASCDAMQPITKAVGESWLRARADATRSR